MVRQGLDKILTMFCPICGGETMKHKQVGDDDSISVCEECGYTE
jgi:predicted RNA-binding Zn-ribbon protein involved in translation (DUF1610 family)